MRRYRRMRKIFLFLCLHLCAAGVLSAASLSVTETTLSGQRTLVLGNEYVRAAVVPGTMGATVGLYWIPGKAELFNPYRYTRTTVNELLPDRQTVTFWGSRTLFWNGTVLFYQPLNDVRTKADDSSVSVSMTGRFIGGFPVAMTRRVTLACDSALLAIGVTVANFGKAPQEIRLWEHLVPSPEGAIPDVSMIAGPGVRRLGRYQDTEKHEGGFLLDTFEDGNLNRFIVPGSDWIAASGGRMPVTVFLRTNAENLAEDGFFYTQKDAAAKLHTVEMLLRRFTLKPGESRTVELELGILSGLAVLRRLSGSHGFDFRRTGNELTWRAASVRVSPAAKCTVSAGDWRCEFVIPALKPGRCASGKISGVPALPDDAFTFTVRPGSR